MLLYVIQALEYLLVHCGANPSSTDGSNGASLLHWAGQRGNSAVVQLLIQNGAEVDKMVRKETIKTLTLYFACFDNCRIGKEILHYLKHQKMVMLILLILLLNSMCYQ